MRLGLAALAIAALQALGLTTVRAEPAGNQLLARFECNRCHEGTGLPEVPSEKHCVRCHQEILAGTFQVPSEVLKTWQGHIVSLPVVPSLTATGARLRRSWVESFLLKPHDLRPGLLALMPRLALTPQLARSIAATLVPQEPAPPTRSLGDADAGRRLIEPLGCGTCHRFSGVPAIAAAPLPVPVPAAQLTRALALAPDLRYTRGRFQPGALVSWLRAPAALKPDTLMPQIPLTEKQAQDLAAYILTAPLAPTVRMPVPPRLPVLTRRVSFDEVNEQVLRRTCWHCHSTPEYALGDGGPGNTGGFGFTGRGLNVATYADLAAGSLDEKGRRRSIFLPVADGTPRLLAVLLARQRELSGELVPGLRGMPLGLPALTAEQIQLVESWLRQGRPR